VDGIYLSQHRVTMSAKPSQSAAGLAFVFILWYGFNCGYNVYNSFVKSQFAFPYCISFLQLAVGLPYAISLWAVGVRKLPKLGLGDIITLLPIVMLNAGGHVSAVIAMFTPGGGSFTHVIKASEPVVSVILGLLINGNIPKPLTALSLLPITYGVAYASTLGNLNVASMTKELTTTAAKMAMTSNVAFALRSIVRKNLKSDFKVRTGMDDPANEHAVTTLLSALITIPALYFMEGIPKLQNAYEAMADKQSFIINVVVCGLCYYLYNEMQVVICLYILYCT
jgi:solute carrier family 35, member E1